MAYETLQYEVQEGIATITLNRPDVLNAFNEQMFRELQDVLRAVERDEAVRVVIVTGAGRGFCAGQDLAEMRARYERPEEAMSIGEHLRSRYNPLILRIRNTEKPFIAAINGVAAGAGCSLALACDLRVMAETASFVFNAFAKIALIPDSGSTWFLPHLAGYARAFEAATLIDRLDASRALAWGLVNAVVPPDQVMPTAQEWAARLRELPARAVGFLKRALNRALTFTLEQSLDYEAHLQEVAARTPEHRERVEAFLRRRG
ncbi:MULTISPECIES: enoyl-CoA hydratase-related protein [Thermoflexus]|jgi:2-(1,2-epoxy-1,2-dihydrophenyl)acetyl-CoA isomerase|uniref:enoyl-CoA hydratase-related protein n=2 Tax=Thermoflexaceae TaxID=1495648 RepID=UPI001C743053|nr:MULTISPECIES: enoyl-CoA hydratase-related protein [Thermoflexus]QWK10495.1 MAG: enoyl-CoA hydratase/isomerase family protein [Thermoflexus hugenholtzii]